MSNQSDFDRFIIARWRENNAKHNALSVVCSYLVRVNDAWHHLPVEEVVAKLKELGITRYPTNLYAPIGTFLMTHYPEFFDRVAKTKDARTIDLSTLRYVVPSLKNSRMQMDTSRAKRRCANNLMSAKIEHRALTVQLNGKHNQGFKKR
jgi:hypothetical protein